MIFGYANVIAGWVQNHAGEGATLDARIQVYDTDAQEAARIVAVNDAVQFVDALKGHPKYSVVVRDNATGLPGISGNMNREWRLKSKGALYYFTRVANKHVHFQLDGIDMTEVVNKSHNYGPPQGRDNPVGKASPGDHDTKKRTITHAELRWIFRNKVFPEVREHIQFWLNNACCEPPWVGGNGYVIWSGYHPSSSPSTISTMNELD
jgi:hypothetical protein